MVCVARVGFFAFFFIVAGVAAEPDLDELPRETIAVDSAEAKAAAAFMLEELRALSDSGVYETLSLHSITSAAKQHGVFHDNVFLTVRLASPHLAVAAAGTTSSGGAPATTVHEVMVMTSLEDGVKSFAIDEFPEMDDDAVEEFLIRKIEKRRRDREESFAQIEREFAEREKKRVGQSQHQEL